MDLPPAPTPPVSGGVGPNSERTANLLNLLKFSGPGSSKEPLQASNQMGQGQAQAHAQAPLPASLSSAQQHQQAGESPSQSHSHPELSSMQQQLERQDDEVDDEDDEEQYQRIQHLQMQSSSNQFQPRIHQPAPTAADPTGLLAALMRGTHEIDEPKSAPTPPQVPAQPANTFANGTPPPNTRSYLLNLLIRPKPSQINQPLLVKSSRSN